MKKMRKLIPAFAMLLVSAIMMSTASFAWFTIGTKAYATGMQIEATAGSALIISTAATYDAFSAANNKVNFGTTAEKLAPATRDASFTTNQYNLKVPANTGAVDAATGSYDGTTNGWNPATPNSEYVVYPTYLATAGATMNDQQLWVKVTLPDGFTDANNQNGWKYIHNAVTIDFWVTGWTANAAGENTATAAYKQTVTLRDVKADEDGYVRVQLVDDIDIPLVIDDEADQTPSYITVTMVVYFDGAMVDATHANGYTYVRNQRITDVAAKFEVEFEAIANAAGN